MPPEGTVLAEQTLDDRPELCAGAGPTTLARLRTPRAATPTTLAVVSDPHVSTRADGTWKVFHRTEARLQAALADAAARGVDGVAFAGDLTKDGHPDDFAAVADLLDGVDAPAVAVPGNHDVPKAFDDHETPPITDFAERFGPGDLPYRTPIGDVDVVGLNSAATPDGRLADSHDGELSEDQLAWLDATLPETGAALVVSHHNLPGLDDCVGEDAEVPHPPVGAGDAVADLLAGRNALHVSGHVHLPAVTRCGDIRGLICPALSSFPQAYLLVSVGPAGTTVELVPVADPAGLAEAYELGRTHTDRSAALTETVAAKLAALPLVDEA